MANEATEATSQATPFWMQILSGVIVGLIVAEVVRNH